MPARAKPALVPPSRVSYWQASRAPRYSVLFALPLLLLYEAMAAFLPTGHGPELRNGADVLLWDFFLTLAGRRARPRLQYGRTTARRQLPRALLPRRGSCCPSAPDSMRSCCSA